MKNTAREISFHFIPSKWGECHYLFPQPSKIEFCRAFFFFFPKMFYSFILKESLIKQK